ncbi:Putative HMP/thiamine import ATP-binding protein YkoD [Corynebacterium felinum]|nr:Putative HMP/thiamine import ATP-binding protein YkoD [Corynebacterium felinum]
MDIAHVRYSAVQADVVHDFSFHPRPGSVTLICGASGSGKSSVLRLINGLIPHFHQAEVEGTVTVGKLDVSTMELYRSGELCATVFQNPRTQFFTTEVDSELAFAGQNFHVPAQEIARRSAMALNRIGITELAGRSLHQLSGGQLQKVACAQAMAQYTPIVLFDEPTSNLDPGAIEDFSAVIAALKEEGKTIVIAEHRLYFLRALVDEVLVLDNGTVTHRFSGEEFFGLDQSFVHELGLRRTLPPTLEVEADHPSVSEVSPKDAGVVIESLRVSFGKTPVLDVAGVFFPSGVVTGVVGPNGAGKTTLARVLVGVQKADRGSKISGVRSAFLVMQDVHRQLFAERVDKEAPMEFLVPMGLDTLASRHPLSLSGGQKQRLVCATAMSMNAQVVIFDEPTSGVDYRHLQSISQLLRTLAEQGKVVIVISHDYEFLNHCADRIVELQPHG